MGKIRTKIIGLEEIEKQQKEEAKKRQLAKKEKKGETITDAENPRIDTPVEDILEADKAKEDAKKSSENEPRDITEDAEDKKLPPQLRRKKVTGAKYKKAAKKVDENKAYAVADAVKLIKDMSYASFDETVELQLVVKEKGLKGEVQLPHGTGKELNVAVLDDKVLKQIEKGTYDFDVLIAAPNQMSQLVPFARSLGPKGLMPNPKKGTVSDKPEEAAKKFKGGNVHYKTEPKAALIHQPVGKVSFDDKKLIENIETFMKDINAKNIRKASLSSTMSPGVRLEVEEK